MPIYPLGATAKDMITGFTGVIVCRSEWINGCIRYALQPTKLKDGLPIEPQYVDEPQLDLIEVARGRTIPAAGGPQKDYRPKNKA